MEQPFWQSMSELAVMRAHIPEERRARSGGWHFLVERFTQPIDRASLFAIAEHLDLPIAPVWRVRTSA